MVSLGILLVLAVVVIGFGATRLHGRAPVVPGSPAAVPDGRLDRWVTAGLVSAEQAAAIPDAVADQGVQAVYASRALRAQLTAAPLAAAAVKL